ncbi:MULTISPECIES: hypothetical protein [Pseudonocardia]|uniref:YGGT family protein n=1 Tax=Pseudonocardia oroxyli TaxID=366584 RepID=A0A1G7UVM2_PSEOR|nr:MULTISPECIES: hypothetical protein [Pseudonocardia]MCF7551652.1 hypothetical protein [Pseudonocardia sp. WMMC193]SDG50770.1 hypothetical protein SAMN05216377_112146 [Pseudonocardia oroxyli]
MAVGTNVRRGAGLLARVLNLVGMLIVAVLVVHIVLTLLDANPANFLTEFVRDLATYFNLGLDNLFLPAEPKLAVTLNYGTAAIIWLIITAVVVRLVRRIG